MKKSLLKLVFCIVIGVIVINIQVYASNQKNAKTVYQYQYNTIPLKQPTMSKSMMPAVAKYKQGNYVEAMLDLEKLVEKEHNNTFAKYYLALTYSQIGYKEKAKAVYQEIADSNDNYSLARYSNMALVCMENPSDEICAAPKKNTAPETKPATEVKEEKELDDITKFILSGKQIHPAAMDKITNERMQRKLQADLYSIQQAENPDQDMPKANRRRHSSSVNNEDSVKKSDASTPSGEEIIAALDTLSKAGLNPFIQQDLFNNPFNALFGAISLFGTQDKYQDPMLNTFLSKGFTDSADMLIYAKMVQQNNILNYGI